MNKKEISKNNLELSDAALSGVGGLIVNTLLPHTEADAAGLLSQFLAAFGSVVGRGPHFQAEAARHGTNLFIINVGDTAKGRKGTAWSHIERLMTLAAPEWVATNVRSGLSSGEGLVAAICDPSLHKDAPPPVMDKRLLCLEPEFSSVLRVAERDGNVLSPTLRNAWDGRRLQTITRKTPLTATDPHVSIVGHITSYELTKFLSTTDITNGLGNRFLCFNVKRSKKLPHGGKVDEADLKMLTSEIAASIEFAKSVSLYERDSQANEMWEVIYDELSDAKPGLAGNLLSRGEPQVMRLALITAILNRRKVIDAESLGIAYQIFQHCEQTVLNIYGQSTGDKYSDKILDGLDERPDGMTRSEISNIFSRNASSPNLQFSLDALLKNRLAGFVKIETDGRPAELWFSSKFKERYELNEETIDISLNSSIFPMTGVENAQPLR